MRRKAGVSASLILAALILVVFALGGCTNTDSGTTIQPSRSDMVACASINDTVEGVFAKLSTAGQQEAAQTTLQLGLEAANTHLESEAHRLQSDAIAANQTAVDQDLSDMAKTCDQMGIGPKSTSHLGTG